MKFSWIKKIFGTTAGATTGVAAQAGFAALATTIGVPAAAIPTLSGILNSVVTSTSTDFYNDLMSRQISSRQVSRSQEVMRLAFQRFMALYNQNPDKIYTGEYTAQQLWESLEGVILKAINENQHKKIALMGNYLGDSLFNGSIHNTDDMQACTEMLSKLTYRQCVLIKLIAEKFPGYDTTQMPSNGHAIVEINQLLNYGFWQLTQHTWLWGGNSNDMAYKLEDLVATDYCQTFANTVLVDEIPQQDIQMVMDSLKLESTE